jgi:RNA recognition motif-containing protein
VDLYIGNLSYLTTADDLAALLAPFDLASPPVLALDPETGLPRGYAIATFATAAGATAAAETLNGTVLDGRVIIVRPAHPGQ